MLSPESRRSPGMQPARLDPDSNAGSAGDGRGIPDRSRDRAQGTSGSSARRQTGQAAIPRTSIPLAVPRRASRSTPSCSRRPSASGGWGRSSAPWIPSSTARSRLKLLPPDQAADPEVVQRFYQEGRSAAQLDHENIARVFSIGQDGLFHYIAFEYIEGETIRHRVEATGPLSVGEAVDVALQIANALVHASRRGVIHRDIKPSNIILTPQGRAKLVDMGLARRFERGGDHGLTQSGMTLGTFDYISPEQARDPRDVDVRSDLYSLGCTLFHMLTGRPPFPGGTVLQKLIQHQEEPPADVRTLNPDVPGRAGGDHRQADGQGARSALPGARAPGARPPAAGGLAGHRADAVRARELDGAGPAPVVGATPRLAAARRWDSCVVDLAARLVGSGDSAGRRRPPPACRPREASRRRARAESRPDPRAWRTAPSPVETTAAAGPDRARAPRIPRTIPRRAPARTSPATLAAAPPRSVIVLADDGPYRLGGGTWIRRRRRRRRPTPT